MLIKSQADLVRINSLLDKKVPPYRKAYSDRTAWIMACLSELAYLRFNPLLPNGEDVDWLRKKVLRVLNDDKKSSFDTLVDMFAYNHNEEREKLEADLQNLKIDITNIEMFDCNETQAILVPYDDFIVLAFRGTERKSIKDIKADANAKISQCETGGRIHSGFKEAFEEAALDIQKKLNKDTTLQDKPLFITGHSLGGALATIAAKKLSHKGGIAACYTFGSPRVGDEEWIADIKTPVYRIVNAADCVTMLPPGDETITVIALLCRYIGRFIAWLRFPVIPQLAKLFEQWLISNYGGYIHSGDMRYMTNCKNGQYNDVKLLYSASIFRRIRGWLVKKYTWEKFLSDHSISIYREKLMIIAEKRNPDKLNAPLAE